MYRCVRVCGNINSNAPLYYTLLPVGPVVQDRKSNKTGPLLPDANDPATRLVLYGGKFLFFLPPSLPLLLPLPNKKKKKKKDRNTLRALWAIREPGTSAGPPHRIPWPQ